MDRCAWTPYNYPGYFDDYFQYDQCNHPRHEGHEFCIFHIPLIEKRKNKKLAELFASEFDRQFFKGEPLSRTELFGADYPYQRNNGNKPLKESAIPAFMGFEFPDHINLSRYTFGREPEQADRDNQSTSTVFRVNFHYAIFGDNICFARAIFDDNSWFIGAVFGISATFQRTIFGKNINFSGSIFGSEADFQGAQFKGSANLYGVTLGNNAQFSQTHFRDEASIEHTIFGDNSDFSHCTFGGDTSFSLAFFGDKTNFTGASFRGNTNFDIATFSGETYFRDTIFSGSTSFKGARGRESAYELSLKKQGESTACYSGEMREHNAPKLLFDKTSFYGLANFQLCDLSQARFQQVDLKNLSFLYSQIAETRFISCAWGKGIENSRYWRRDLLPRFRFRRKRLLLDELLWRKKQSNRWQSPKPALDPFVHLWRLAFPMPRSHKPDHVMVEAEPGKDLMYGDIMSEALQLKQSLENSKEPISAGDFHFAVMEMKRVEAKERGNGFRAAMLWVYKMINGYGERYGRTALWLALLVAGFSLLYWQVCPAGLHLSQNGSSTAPAAKITYWDYLLYALQNVLPFKFSQPVFQAVDSCARWLSFAETFIGTSLFTFFALALRRRFKR